MTPALKKTSGTFRSAFGLDHRSTAPAFMVTATMLAFCAAAKGADYSFSNLGSVSNVTLGYGLNNNANVEVVGSLGNHSAFSTGGASFAAFGTVNDSTAYAVNDGGVIVGGGADANSSAFYATGNSPSAMNLPTSFGTSDPGTTSGVNAALAVNGNGTVFEVVGRSAIDDVPENPRAFLWTPGATTLTPLAANDGTGLGGSGDTATSVATGINTAGQIVGQATITNNTAAHAFFYSAGKMYDIGTESGTGDSIANAINDSGEIVGQTNTDGNTSEAFIYNGYQSHLPTDTSNPDTQIVDNGYFTLLDLGGDEGEALSVNASGQVVGDSTTADGAEHAFVYSAGSLFDLNSLVSNLPSGFTLDSATGINNAGQITGIADDGTNDYAFLLTVSSVPEPSLAGILLCVLAIQYKRRRPHVVATSRRSPLLDTSNTSDAAAPV